MKITADTNVLVRAAVQDEPRQARRAIKVLKEAELVAVPSTALCEFVWVLRRGYKLPRSEVSEAIQRLLATPKIVVDRPAVEAGLAALDAGGDFADGIIAHEGMWLGAHEFVSFDAKAVRLLQSQGGRARPL